MTFRCFCQNELYETTTVSGFRFVNLSNSKVEVIFWYIIIICFASITIITLHGSVENYLSNPTVTSVAIASAKDDDIRTPYIFLSVPLSEFANVQYIDNPMKYFNDVNNNAFTLLTNQQQLFHNVSAETILNYWFVIKDFYVIEISEVLSPTWCNYDFQDDNRSLQIELAFEKEKCVKSKHMFEKNVKKLQKTIDFLPTIEETFLNIILRLYTLQDTFYQELEQLENETNLFHYTHKVQSNSKVYYIDELMGGSHIGKELTDAAKTVNITMKHILQSCDAFLEDSYTLYYLSKPAEIVEFGQRRYDNLVLQGIRLVPGTARLEFKFFPNETKDVIKDDGTNIKTTIAVQPGYISHKILEYVRNEEFHEFKTIYSFYGYVVYIEDPDNVDQVASNWWENHPPEMLGKPFTITAFNYVIAGKHIPQYNKSCNMSKRLQRCFANCKARIYTNYCNCVPWGLTIDYETKQVCEDPQSCLKNKIGDILEQCKSECSFCETIVWRRDTGQPSLFPVNKANLQISWTHMKMNTIYPMFQENYKYTTGTFLAQIGGQMDLWVGCSVIGVLHIIIFMCKQIYRHVQHWKKKYRVKNDNEMVDYGESKVPVHEVPPMSSLEQKRLNKEATDSNYDHQIEGTTSDEREQTFTMGTNETSKPTIDRDTMLQFRTIKKLYEQDNNRLRMQIRELKISNEKRDKEMIEMKKYLFKMASDPKCMT